MLNKLMGCYPDSEHKKETLFWPVACVKISRAIWSKDDLRNVLDSETFSLKYSASNFELLKSQVISSRFSIRFISILGFAILRSVSSRFEATRFHRLWSQQCRGCLVGVPDCAPGAQRQGARFPSRIMSSRIMSPPNYLIIISYSTI